MQRTGKSYRRGLTLGGLHVYTCTYRECRRMTNKTKKLAAEAVSDCIATRLRLATRVITKVYDDALRPFGLTASQMALLALAAGREFIQQAEVSSVLQMDN